MKLQLKVVGKSLFDRLSDPIHCKINNLPRNFQNEPINWILEYYSPESRPEDLRRGADGGGVLLIDGNDETAVKCMHRLEKQFQIKKSAGLTKEICIDPVIVLIPKIKTAEILNFPEIVADWVHSPLEISELANRIFFRLKLLRGAGGVLQYGGVTVIKDTRQATYGDRSIRLSPSEFILLELLIIRMGAMVPSEDLVDLFQSVGKSCLPNNIRVTTFQLRLKLEILTKSMITIASVRGRGYCLRQKSNHKNSFSGE
jgi:DNA-binding winged helix-turn-helix (wHTH) protein